MLYGPDCISSDEEGLSDDNDYYEFKQRLKANRGQAVQEVTSEADLNKKRLKSVFSAVSYGKTDLVFDELDKGLDVNIDLELGWTLLLLASTLPNENIISGLIERGADINQSRDGATPLMLVCNNISKDEDSEKNISACVKLLISKNADVNVVDSKRRTAIMFAAHNSHVETVKLLLPLVDKNAEDNQRWDVLFYAVDGNSPALVELLLKEGFSCEKVDIRGYTVMDLAHNNGFTEILNLMPKDPFDEFYTLVNNNQANFCETFSTIGKNETPQFFNDICKILYATRSECVMPILWDKKITLFDFLSMNDSKLEELGIRFPYQRRRIMGGLFRFHKHPFQPKSIPFVHKNQLYTNLDVAATALTCIKQQITMQASLKFILENCDSRLDLSESKEVRILIAKNRQQISRLKLVTREFVRKTEQWDLTLKPADKITKKRRNIPWCNIWLSIGLISLVILFKMK